MGLNLLSISYEYVYVDDVMFLLCMSKGGTGSARALEKKARPNTNPI